MTSLLNQAPEVLHDIFLHVEPSDLASVAQTCRYLNTFVEKDALLWRQQYLTWFDRPASESSNELQWSELLKTNVAVEKLLKSTRDELKTEAELERVANLALDLVLKSTSSTTKNSHFLRDLFKDNDSNISAFICRSSLFAPTRLPTDTPASTPVLRQLSAKLHVFSGMEVEPPCLSSSGTITTRSTLDGAQHVHPYARSRVYDLRRYKRSNHWGPFLDDGSSAIDWEKVQSIMLVILYNVRVYAERGGPGFSPPYIGPGSLRRHLLNPSSRRRAFSGPSGAIFDTPFYGLAPNSYISEPLPPPLRAPPNPDLAALDPYGVTGTWMRIVCFLDYSDLYNFNFDAPRPLESEEREPINTREAFRLIKLKMHVTAVEPPGDDDHPDFPVVKFEGTSRSTLNAWDPNANSRIRGTVRTTASRAIRWTTFSIFHGEERWRSEGVQIGGIRSARGILGNWFDKDYELAGPAGPTCFWKVSDDIAADENSGRGSAAFGGAAVGAGLGLGGDGGEEGGDDEDDSDFVDEEGEGVGGAGGAGGGVTLADLGLLGGQAGGAGLVVPLHEVVNLLFQTLNGGGGGGQGILRLEDLQGLLGAVAGDDARGEGEEEDEGSGDATGGEPSGEQS